MQKLLEVCVYLKNKTWRKKKHKTKLLKLLGISLIVGILGLTGFCKKSEDNNDLALGAGLLVAQQQAEQAAQWFCAIVSKSGTTYNAMLTPLVAQDCNVNYWGSSTNAIKQRLLETIGDPDLSSNCPNTRNLNLVLIFLMDLDDRCKKNLSM